MFYDIKYFDWWNNNNLYVDDSDFLVSSKYQNVIEPLDDEEFVLKECYGVGFHLMKLLRVNLKGTIALKMRKDAVVIYGENMQNIM